MSFYRFNKINTAITLNSNSYKVGVMRDCHLGALTCVRENVSEIC